MRNPATLEGLARSRMGGRHVYYTARVALGSR
jgi:hypothetical protein